MNKLCLLLIILITISSQGIAQTQYPIIAHSHNDYDQKHPIVTALEYGFNSLEVDIAYDGTKILVAHDIDQLDNKPLFEDSYLIPLIEKLKITKNNLWLLIDIKNYSDELIQHLHKTISKYDSHLVKRNELSNSELKIQIILSGNIPRKKIIQNDDFIYFFIDGRMEEIDTEFYSLYTPLISLNFKDVTNWKGINRPSTQTIKKLSSIINRVHKKDKYLRFWNTNETIMLWSTLIGLKVDVIGVDNIEQFHLKLEGVNLLKEAKTH